MMFNLNVNEFVEGVNKNSEDHGFRENMQSRDEYQLKALEYVSLIHSEVSEILEEFRKGHNATEIYYKDGKPEGVPMELADVIIRCFDMAGYYGIDLEKAINEKMEYNIKRPYKHGKQF